LISTMFRLTLGHTQFPVQWVPEAFYPGVKRPGSEASHFPPSSAEDRKRWNNTSTLSSVLMSWLLIKGKENVLLYYF
jgi:hypothetical protein